MKIFSNILLAKSFKILKQLARLFHCPLSSLISAAGIQYRRKIFKDMTQLAFWFKCDPIVSVKYLSGTIKSDRNSSESSLGHICQLYNPNGTLFASLAFKVSKLQTYFQEHSMRSVIHPSRLHNICSQDSFVKMIISCKPINELSWSNHLPEFGPQERPPIKAYIVLNRTRKVRYNTDRLWQQGGFL